MDGGADRRDAEILDLMSAVAAQALDLDRSLDTVLELLEDTASLVRAAVALKDHQTGQFRIRASRGLDLREQECIGTYTDDSLIQLVLKTAEPLWIHGVRKAPLFAGLQGGKAESEVGQSLIGIPILDDGGLVGVLYAALMCDEENSFERVARMIGSLATLVSQLASLKHNVEQRETVLLKANLALRMEILKKLDNFLAETDDFRMAEVQRTVREAALSGRAVVISGEHGSGKTLSAEVIHQLSPGPHAPFIRVNCRSLSSAELESRIFGGAVAGDGTLKHLAGLLDQIHEGTIFLYRIETLTESVQDKFLRYLEDRAPARRSAGTGGQGLRIIVATEADPAGNVALRAFLEALSRVLDCVPIAIPPLRERAGEIRKLTEYFVGWFCEQYGSRLQFTGRAMQALQEYSWPGNVRELENLVECLALTGENVEVGLPDLPPYLAAGSTALATLGNGCEDSLWAIERRSVISALERNYWIQSRAARELGITLRQMGYRVKKYGLEDLVKSNKRRLLTHSGKVQRQHQAGMSPR